MAPFRVPTSTIRRPASRLSTRHPTSRSLSCRWPCLARQMSCALGRRPSNPPPPPPKRRPSWHGGGAAPVNAVSFPSSRASPDARVHPQCRRSDMLCPWVTYPTMLHPATFQSPEPTPAAPQIHPLLDGESTAGPKLLFDLSYHIQPAAHHVVQPDNRDAAAAGGTARAHDVPPCAADDDPVRAAVGLANCARAAHDVVRAVPVPVHAREAEDALITVSTTCSWHFTARCSGRSGRSRCSSRHARSPRSQARTRAGAGRTPA